MKPVITRGSLVTCDSEAIILFLFENSPLRGAARTVDERSGGLLSLVLDAGDFRGKLFELNLLYPKGLIGPQRILLTGLGKKEDATLDILRGAASKAAQKIRDLHIGSFALSLDIGIDSFSVARRAEAIIEGTALGLYRFLIFKSEKDEFKDEIETLTIVEEDPSLLGIIGDAAAYAVAIADAVSFTRDLVAAPSNEMTPSVLAERARSVASDTVTVEVLHREAIEFLGMNAFLSVAKGSAEPPTFTIMKYDGGTPGSRPVVLVGKGITFDSGGICLKPAERMDEMKTDMAGAAAVIGTVKAAAALALPVTLIGLIPAAENLPSGHACKPGDIITSLSGKTIEVINT
ncbi:MAG: leucyl aminopeptidase, partial [Deltaproteobacteria bacterium]|nr:leucyl aminopeptidase [Deltaproteobacteria bacterium]